MYLDSGVRRGSDVLKALALGARAVGVGRPLYWGLAVNGAEGCMACWNCCEMSWIRCWATAARPMYSSLEPGVVTVPYGWGNGKMYP